MELLILVVIILYAMFVIKSVKVGAKIGTKVANTILPPGTIERAAEKMFAKSPEEVALQEIEENKKNKENEEYWFKVGKKLYNFKEWNSSIYNYKEWSPLTWSIVAITGIIVWAIFRF